MQRSQGSRGIQGDRGGGRRVLLRRQRLPRFVGESSSVTLWRRFESTRWVAGGLRSSRAEEHHLKAAVAAAVLTSSPWMMRRPREKKPHLRG